MLFSESATIPVFRYNSIPLKFQSGKVEILAADGHTAYIGEVSKGAASGQGDLYRADGSLLYSGAFSDSRYNGDGKLYYPNGVLQYEGAFVDNLFEGQGTQYRQSGVMEYAGQFLKGQWSGAGVLYNSGGNSYRVGCSWVRRPRAPPAHILMDLMDKLTTLLTAMVEPTDKAHHDAEVARVR